MDYMVAAASPSGGALHFGSRERPVELRVR